MTDITLFDQRGKFIGATATIPDTWDQSKKDRFEILRAAAVDKEQSESGLAMAQAWVTTCVAAFKVARDAEALAHPKRTFLDEWRASRDAGMAS